MTSFQQTTLLITVIWAVLVFVRFRRSSIFLVGGLFVIGIYTLIFFLLGNVTLNEIGLSLPISWPPTFGFAIAGRFCHARIQSHG